MSEFAIFHLNAGCKRCQVFADLEQIEEHELSRVAARMRRLGWTVESRGNADFHISCSECATPTSRRATRRVLVPLVADPVPQHFGLANALTSAIRSASRCLPLFSRS